MYISDVLISGLGCRPIVIGTVIVIPEDGEHAVRGFQLCKNVFEVLVRGFCVDNITSENNKFGLLCVNQVHGFCRAAWSPFQLPVCISEICAMRYRRKRQED